MIAVEKFAPYFTKWVNDKIGSEFTPENSRYIAYVSGDEVLAVAVFDHWTKYQVEVSIASDGTKRWASRTFIRAIYDYAFTIPSCSRINMIVEVKNKDAIRLHEALGHTLEGQLVDWFGTGNDAFLYRLTKTEYLEGKWSKNDKL